MSRFVLDVVRPTTFGSKRAHCTIEPQGAFGHPPMTMPELIANLRDRSEHARAIDDVAVSKAELHRLLDALENKP